MQVAFTGRIAEVVGAGVRVMLTTHSEWILEELGNTVGRSKLTDRSDETSGIGSLDAADVGVWLFEPAENGDGSTVKEIALDVDTGLYPTGFDAVATALHNDWAEISGRRGDAE
jgi:predicted ATPase